MSQPPIDLDKIEHDYQDNSNAAKVAAKAPPRPEFKAQTVAEAREEAGVKATRVVMLERKGRSATLDDLRRFLEAATGIPGDTPLGIYAVHEYQGEPSLVQIRVEA